MIAEDQDRQHQQRRRDRTADERLGEIHGGILGLLGPAGRRAHRRLRLDRRGATSRIAVLALRDRAPRASEPKVTVGHDYLAGRHAVGHHRSVRAALAFDLDAPQLDRLGRP